MVSKKAQSKAGIADKRRGQQMGDERSARSRSLEAKEETPALHGRRKRANKFFADESSQQVGSHGVAPRDNTPSLPAAIPTGEKLGESDGERVFKERHSSKTRKPR